MLDSLKLRVLWLIIEQTQTLGLPELSDYEIVQQILEGLQEHILLSPSELSDTRIYLQNRVSLIRDLAEIQLVSGKVLSNRERADQVV